MDYTMSSPLASSVPSISSDDDDTASTVSSATTATTPSQTLSNGCISKESKATINPEVDNARSCKKLVLPAIPKGVDIQPLLSDAATPDNWIPRDEQMIRLTGKHPCNTEAPLSTLFNAGFLTPQNLFYVRNHGDVPRIQKDAAISWRLRVHGLVENELDISVSELKQLFEVITIPVTLVCAGNRRKEQNVVSKGLGFNWGAAGVSTGLFTGVYLADILAYCKPKRPIYASYPLDTVAGRARHVIFEGADQLPNGRYGTSQKLSLAVDRNRGMLLAWGLNGEDLMPDHGYPLRLIVPGQIGGRMVKWLTRIEVSDTESQHHLHFFDNKMLPTQVSADQARLEKKWWYDPKYIINELNVNAAICSPAHNESIAADTPTIVFEGYAYAGGGRRVSRVEITLDDGKTWTLADITYPEDLYRVHPVVQHPYYGTLDLSVTDNCFCWCFWRLKVKLQSLIDQNVSFVALRATDDALNTMPRDMYWNATSMMNSWWFRVAVHQDSDGSVRFEHPTLAGNVGGGWMQRTKEGGQDPRFAHFGGHEIALKRNLPTVLAETETQDVLVDPSLISHLITEEDFAQHSNSSSSPWFIVNGHVYDGGRFLTDHPGGADSIRLVAGEDATDDFMAIHSMDAKKMMPSFHLGKLVQTGQVNIAKVESEEDDQSTPFLHPKKWKLTRLISKKVISPDCRIFRFALSGEDQTLGLPVGQHIYFRVTNKTSGEIVQRMYTPYSGNMQCGFLDILIKVYFPKVATESTTAFAGGRMTMLLENAESESEDLTMELKGPFGHFTYLGAGFVEWPASGQKLKVQNYIMIAGGSGITPIWSTLKAIADEYIDGEGMPQIWLIYGNRTKDDVLLYEELLQLEAKLDGHLHVKHVLSGEINSPVTLQGFSCGRIDLEFLRESIPPPPCNEPLDTLALVCGPKSMEASISASLEDLGWDLDKHVVLF